MVLQAWRNFKRLGHSQSRISIVFDIHLLAFHKPALVCFVSFWCKDWCGVFGCQGIEWPVTMPVSWALV
jgi:hypothetical protein